MNCKKDERKGKRKEGRDKRFSISVASLHPSVHLLFQEGKSTCTTANNSSPFSFPVSPFLENLGPPYTIKREYRITQKHHQLRARASSHRPP